MTAMRSDDLTGSGRSGAARRRLLRPLAVALPVLVIVGLVGVVAVSAHHGTDSERIVTASGEGISSVAAATQSPSTLPATTVPSTTEVPTTLRPTTTTTRPTPPTTHATVLATVPTTSATTLAVAGKAMVTLRNSYPEAVQLKVNGQTYQLAAGQQLGPVSVTPAPSGNDIIELRVSANLGCGEGDAQGYFVAGHRYLLTVAVGPDSCPPSPTSPSFAVTPA
jgi:hypothetical protein